MNQDNTHHNGSEVSNPEKKGYFDRRDILKGLATVPVLGVFFYQLGKKWHSDKNEDDKKNQLISELGLNEAPSILPSGTRKNTDKQLRLGIVGYGSRGEYLLRAAGFAHSSWLESIQMATAENKKDKRYEDFLNQDNLNIVFNGVCDLFDIRAERALEAVRKGSNSSVENTNAKRFRTYRQMLASDDIDAIIIATPEHWHAQIAIDAARAGKHIYLEKPLCLTIPEAYKVAEEVKKSDIKFQLGHQSRQTDAYIMAREVIKQGVLGKISLVTLTTNRNDPNGAWIYPIHHDASPMNIDLKQFMGKTARKPPSAMMKRFFRWRLWYDYGTGLSGDLLTHEFDAVNMILDLGIPSSAVATGGIYYYKDGREVPDVYNATYEYPQKDLTLMYSATLANNTKRGKRIMGSDATMEFGELHASALAVTADSGSKRFKEKIEQGIIDTELPMFSYSPGSKGFDAITSATEKYFAGRGLLYTYRDGRRVDTTHLHIGEWLDAIRTDGDTSCNIDAGFEEAITAHMGTLSYKIGRRVEWDHENNMITNIEPPNDWTDKEIQRILKGMV